MGDDHCWSVRFAFSCAAETRINEEVRSWEMPSVIAAQSPTGLLVLIFFPVKSFVCSIGRDQQLVASVSVDPGRVMRSKMVTQIVRELIFGPVYFDEVGDLSITHSISA